MSQQTRKIDFINIDSEGNYFDTKEQIKIRQETWFVETTAASRLSGSNVVHGLMSRKRVVKDDNVYNSNSYTTSSVIVDSSGNQRKILSSTNDYIISSSIDSYRNGIEITQEKHWTAGVAKITAGSPGHIYDSFRYGYSDLDILSSDTYYELDVFNPVSYVEKGENYLFPIITSDSNESENYLLNGIIEPFPIRSVISNFSINFPFEPHSTKGQFGNGNTSLLFSSDQVLSVDYFLPGKINQNPFLDAVDLIGMMGENGTGVIFGPSSGYLSTGENKLGVFEDTLYARGEAPSLTYTTDLVQALYEMPPGGTTYITSKEESSTCGFILGDAEKGTDSIAFGDRNYGSNRDNRRRKRTIISLKDSESFLAVGSNFNDTNTIHFVSQVVEYPCMLPAQYSGSLMNDTIRSEVYKSGSIQVNRAIRPGNFDSAISDSIVSAKRRTGEF